MSSKLPNAYAACQCCGKKLDGASSLQDETAVPSPGDFSICLYCGTILEYEEGFFLHVASDESLSRLNSEEPEVYQQLIQVQLVIKQMILEKKAKMN